MIRHYFTLAKLKEEFDVLTGCRIVECYTQDKNSMIIDIFNGDNIHHLYFSADTRLGCLHLRRNFNRAKKNSTDLFSELLGQNIKEISLSKNDRIIVFETDDFFLRFILFGGAKNNLIISDKNDKIVNSFKSSAKLKGNNFIINSRKDIQYDENISLQNFLADDIFQHSKFYAREFIKSNELNSDELWFEIQEIRREQIINQALQFKNYILSSSEYCLLTSQTGAFIFSLIELSDMEVQEKFLSVNIGIERRVRKELIEGNLEREKKVLIKRFTTILNKTERTIKQIELGREKLSRANDYRLWAELLMSLNNQKEKPGGCINLTDWEGGKIKIKLNPKETINENAQRYFKKAKDTENNFKIRKEMLPSLDSRKTLLIEIIDKLEKTGTIKQLKKIKEEYISMAGAENNTREGVSRFRQFDLGEGYILYVGKNAANNDELTVKFAKPNDLWMHARGSSGSHAVLRLNKDQKPPKYILKKAASIAAYYSGAKNAKYVPVSYALRKFVHKPKGANPGSVVIRREDVIMVEPKLPE